MKKNLLQWLYSIIFIFCIFQNSMSQNVMMQGWYWNYPKPHDGASWADTLMIKATQLRNAGFTYMWLPGFSRGSSNTYSNGYDPKDYYDLGDAATGGTTAFGTHTQLNNLITKYNSIGVQAIADVVYNHRDGEQPENNGAVKGWVENFNATKYANGDLPFGNDKYTVELPLGGTSGNGAGDYYIKLKSASGHSDFFGKRYKLYFWTNKLGYGAGGDSLVESANNGGGDCGQASDTAYFHKRMFAFIDNTTGGVCGVDEFMIHINATDFNTAGDKLFINIRNDKNVLSDIYIYGVWNAAIGADVHDSLQYHTYTDFTNLPSGRGGMNYLNFKPNGNPTCLCGDEDFPFWYNDIDQNVQSTKDTLFEYTKWLWQNVGIRGFRIDAIKHFPHSFTGQLLSYLNTNNINPSLIVGESYDFNAGTLAYHINQIKNNMSAGALANINVKLFDFDLQAALRDCCDAFGYDARNVFNAGIANQSGMSGYNAITFINNHDFRDPSNSVDTDPLLAYAYILTNNQPGMPCVYYSDYFKNNTYTNSINKLMSIQNRFIAGANMHEYLNRFNTPFGANYTSGSASNSLIYQLAGGGNCSMYNGVLCAVNFSGNALQVNQYLNTSFGFSIVPGDTLLELTGNTTQNYIVVNANSQVNIDVPARSYGIWVKKNLALPNISIAANGPTTFCKSDSVKLISTLSGAEPCAYYIWKRNGQIITGENEANLLVTKSGMYTASVTIGGNIIQNSNSILVTVNPTIPSITRVNDTLISSNASSYLWYYTSSDSLNYSAAPGINNLQKYTIQFPGKYAVQITDANGCTDRSYFKFYSANGTGGGINAMQDYMLTVFPNPAQDNLTIKALIGISEIIITDIQGKIIISKNIENWNTSTTMAINSLSTGIYLVKVKTQDKIFHVQKFIKE